MDNVCKYHKFGYCKYNNQCEKNHVKGECKDGNICPKIQVCNLRHPKMCKRMAMEGYCRLEAKCAYKHGPRVLQPNDDNKEDIKSIKAELDVLKQTVKTLMTIKEEGHVLQKEIKVIKEEIRLVVVQNKVIADKISQLENDVEYESEEEDENEKDEVPSHQHDDRVTKEEENNFDDFEELYQIESVDGELLYACNVCNEALDTENEMKEHLNKDHKELILNINKTADNNHQNLDTMQKSPKRLHVDQSKAEENYSCKACTLLGGSEFKSSTYKDTNDHIMKHLLATKKPEVKANLDDSDLYEGFDEDGNRIADNDEKE